MKISVNWLREYIDINCCVDDLATGLTMAGLEVEETKLISKQDFVDAGGGGARDDIVWDAKVTPNRGDWLSMIGVAREAAPIVGGKMKMPVVEVEGSGPRYSEQIEIGIDDPDLCKRYVGVVIRNVVIRDSPDWMRDRLIAAGMRPINNVVDITNYVMLEFGQPLHAFDYSLLHDCRIIVRRSRPGETITSLDGIERELDPDMLVIADADRPVAIAGIMGGTDSEISKQTKDILIESANFNSVSIRRTAKRLGMTTESSYRFERGVDPSITALAALRAAQLLQELACGSVAKGMVDVYPVPVEPLRIEVRPKRANTILGTSIEAGEMAAHLNSIEINASVANGRLICQVPTFRSDISREIDLIEEIGRVYGYDKLEMTLPRENLQGKDSPEGIFREQVRRLLMSCGAQEALTHSLIDNSLVQVAGRCDQRIVLRNPLTEDLDSMRVTLVPNLLQVIARNQAFGTTELSVFEIGKVYFCTGGGGLDEKLSVSGVMIGRLWKSAWSLPAGTLEVDFFLCKGAVESLLEGLGIGGVSFVETKDPLLHPTRAAKVLIGGREAGMLGEIAPDVAEALDVRGRPYAFELDFAALMEASPKAPRYEGVPRYPALSRHLAAVVADDIRYSDLVGVIEKSGGETVEKVELLDIYKGEHIPVDKRSLTLSITFRASDRTLIDDEVNAALAAIREALKSQAGASFR